MRQKSWHTLASAGTVPPTRCAEQPVNRKTCRCNTPHRGHVDCCGVGRKVQPHSRVAAADLIFRITRELVASTIADMDLDPAALAEVEETFIGAGLL